MNNKDLETWGSIGIVRYWPDKKVAEHENIEKITAALNKLKIKVIEIDSDGWILPFRIKKIAYGDVLFVLNLHFIQGKSYEALSIAALWNPMNFYSMFGFERSITNQLSHDFFVSASGKDIDLAVTSLTKKPISLDLNHSLAGPLIEPSLRTDRKLFYIGINWERINSKKGRFHDLFHRLDKAGVIEIYGPRKIDGVAPWGGFRCYVGELPFNGRAVVETQARLGASLVLSSDEHIKSGIMSNRLFEALAAGTVIISDRHPFIVENFHDCVLLLDENNSDKNTFDQIISYLNWANENVNLAYEMAKKAQQRLLSYYELSGQLTKIISMVSSYQEESIAPTHIKCLTAICFFDDANNDVLSSLSSLLQNRRQNINYIVLVSDDDLARRVCELFVSSQIQDFELIHLCKTYPKLNIKSDFGYLLSDILKLVNTDGLFFVLGQEYYYPNFTFGCELVLSREDKVVNLAYFDRDTRTICASTSSESLNISSLLIKASFLRYDLNSWRHLSMHGFLWLISHRSELVPEFGVLFSSIKANNIPVALSEEDRFFINAFREAPEIRNGITLPAPVTHATRVNRTKEFLKRLPLGSVLIFPLARYLYRLSRRLGIL